MVKILYNLHLFLKMFFLSRRLSPFFLYLILFLLIIFGSLVNKVSAANFQENFDTFTLGNINGQGSFTAIFGSPAVHEVSSVTSKSSPNSMHLEASNVVEYSPGISLGTTFSIWVKPIAVTNVFGNSIAFRSATGGASGQFGFINFFDSGSPTVRIMCDSVSDIDISGFSYNTWQKLDVQFTSSTLYRARFAGSSWTTPCNGEGSLASATSIDRLNFNFSVIEAYFDDMSTSIYSDIILLPPDGSHLSVGSQSFSGECLNVGTDYRFSWSEIYGGSEVECLSDHTWSTDYPVTESGGGGKSYYLCYNLTDECQEVAIIGYVSENQDWFLSLNYPPLVDNQAKVVPDTDFPIRIMYTAPPNSPNVSILVNKYTDETFTTLDYSLVSNNTDILDPDGLGYIETDDDIVDSVVSYYKMSIGDGTLVFYTTYFSIVGSTDSDSSLPVLPGDTDLGPVGNLIRGFILPRYNFLQTKFSLLENVLDDKFGDFYSIRTHFIDSFENITLDNFESPTFTFLGTTVDIIPLDSPIISGMLTYLRPFSAMIFYLLFVVFLVSKIHHFLKP